MASSTIKESAADRQCDLTKEVTLPETAALLRRQKGFGADCQSFRVSGKQLVELQDRFGPSAEKGGFLAESAGRGQYKVRLHADGSSHSDPGGEVATSTDVTQTELPIERNYDQCEQEDSRCRNEAILAKQTILEGPLKQRLDDCKKLTESGYIDFSDEVKGMVGTECAHAYFAGKALAVSDVEDYLKATGLSAEDASELARTIELDGMLGDGNDPVKRYDIPTDLSSSDLQQMHEKASANLRRP